MILEGEEGGGRMEEMVVKKERERERGLGVVSKKMKDELELGGGESVSGTAPMAS